MRFLFVLCSVFLVACTGLEQYVAFDAASASSTYSAGNLVGSPAFTAQQALSGGSGYWCDCTFHFMLILPEHVSINEVLWWRARKSADSDMDRSIKFTPHSLGFEDRLGL